jgi:hypothetical protein
MRLAAKNGWRPAHESWTAPASRFHLFTYESHEDYFDVAGAACCSLVGGTSPFSRMYVTIFP